jgi:glutamine amidotransferase
VVAVIDYNMGNLGSVINAVTKVGGRASLVSRPEELKGCSRAILPGVGAFPDAMKHLKSTQMDEAIREFIESGRAILGTCLGVQLLFDESEEFKLTRGLGLIPGKVVRFKSDKFDRELKTPHMGWNELFVERGDSIFKGLPKEFYLYFVHSYHIQTDKRFVIGSTYYGYKFVSAVNRDNIYGFQPHPEKSHNVGLKILENFLKL